VNVLVECGVRQLREQWQGVDVDLYMDIHLLQENTMEKSLGNTDINGTKKNVPDVVVFGDGDMFKLLCKASSQSQGWMKSTKAKVIKGVGAVLQVTTQQKNRDGSYSVAEAVTFIPDVDIEETHDEDGLVIGRKLISAK
jgi:hypothetical protein